MTDSGFHGALLWPLPAELEGGSKSRYFIDTKFTDFRQCRLIAWLVSVPAAAGPLLCYDHETDLNLFRFPLGGPLPRGWRIENIAGRRERARRAAYFARHGGEPHALHDARANAYACAG